MALSLGWRDVRKEQAGELAAAFVERFLPRKDFRWSNSPLHVPFEPARRTPCLSSPVHTMCILAHRRLGTQSWLPGTIGWKCNPWLRLTTHASTSRQPRQRMVRFDPIESRGSIIRPAPALIYW